MICLRVSRHPTNTSNREEFLYLNPGDFYISESVDRDSGANHVTYIITDNGSSQYKVVETAAEIEAKIKEAAL